MEAKYIKAIKTGICDGIVILVILAIEHLLSLIGSGLLNAGASASVDEAACILSAIVFPACVAITFASGMFAVRSAAPMLTGPSDDAVVAGIAGLVAGVFWALSYLVLGILGMQGDNQSLANAAALAMMCCIPEIICISIVSALIGGTAYNALVLRKELK